MIINPRDVVITANVIVGDAADVRAFPNSLADDTVLAVLGQCEMVLEGGSAQRLRDALDDALRQQNRPHGQDSSDVR